MRFLPVRQLPARETLCISAAGCTLKVHLAGQGVSPTLRLDVPAADASPLSMPPLAKSPLSSVCSVEPTPRCPPAPPAPKR